MSLRCQAMIVSGGDDGGEGFQSSSAKRLALGSQSASLVVGEQYPFAAGFELLLQDPVLAIRSDPE
jgi:hypothetical protein